MAETNGFPALFPDCLLDLEDNAQLTDLERCWRAVYTMSRQEKALARELHVLEIPYYLPLVKQTKVYNRRRVTNLMPVFPNYVFVHCNEDERVACLTTNRISRILDVTDQENLRKDLNQLRQLIASNAPLTVERRLSPGQRVRIKTGSMMGIEGTVIERHGEKRLLVAVNFLQQGASVAIDDFMLETC